MSTVASINGAESAASAAAAATSVNIGLLSQTENLAKDLVNRLFASLGLGANVNTLA